MRFPWTIATVELSVTRTGQLHFLFQIYLSPGLPSGMLPGCVGFYLRCSQDMVSLESSIPTFLCRPMDFSVPTMTWSKGTLALGEVAVDLEALQGQAQAVAAIWGKDLQHAHAALVVLPYEAGQAAVHKGAENDTGLQTVLHILRVVEEAVAVQDRLEEAHVQGPHVGPDRPGSPRK